MQLIDNQLICIELRSSRLQPYPLPTESKKVRSTATFVEKQWINPFWMRFLIEALSYIQMLIF
jgi:hypothetical protein